jgi:hypothetical protein
MVMETTAPATDVEFELQQLPSVLSFDGDLEAGHCSGCYCCSGCSH